MNIFQPPNLFLQKADRAIKMRAAEREHKRFFKHENDTALYFFLLPPWSERGALHRTISTHFGLPGSKYHICWKSYEVLPGGEGMGDQCPICLALKAVEGVAGKEIRQMRPTCRGYVNALIVGTWRLDDERGNAVGSFIPFAEENPKAPRILPLPPSVTEELMIAQRGPMGFICMPDKAVMCTLKKTGTSLATRYDLFFAGTQTTMFATKEEAFACLGEDGHSGLPDLDKIWMIPDGDAVNSAYRIASCIRMTFGLPPISAPQPARPCPPPMRSMTSPSRVLPVQSAPPMPPVPHGLMTVQVAGTGKNGFALPTPEAVKAKNNGVVLDLEVIRAKEAESAEVEALLSEIFVEEAPPPMSSQAHVEDLGGSLDARYAQILGMLLEKRQMSRSEFEQQAAVLGLMPDGVFDKINDVAFEICERPVCEGDDPIRVNVEVAMEMLT